MKNEFIYMDNAATTIPIDRQYSCGKFLGNPSSSHQLGKEARKLLDDTKNLLCENLGGKSYNYFFNSGATESANFIIQGICNYIKSKGIERNEIIISEIEHPAIFNTAKKMESLGFKIKILPVDNNGVINVNEALSLLNQRTAMVCVMVVNNETGVIQPLDLLFKEVKAFNSKIITICDAVQAIFKDVLLPSLNHTDCFFASGHKIGADKGIGFIYMDTNIFIEPLMYGGGQEEGMRSGTENMNGIASLHDSIIYYNKNREHIKSHLKILSKRLYSCLDELDINYSINAKEAMRTEYIHSISFDNLHSGHLTDFLSLNGIYISRGSACSSSLTEIPRVLSAMGLSQETISSTVRISFSPLNNEHEIDLLCKNIFEFKNSL